MPIKFRAEGSTGTVAIYESSDDLPFTDPLNYKSRVYFHSGLNYPARVLTMPGIVNFRALANGSVPEKIEVYEYPLFAHGRASIPLIEGKWIGVGTNGADVPMVGTIPIQQSAVGSPNIRWVTVGADATNVWVHEMFGNTAFGSGLPAITISYEIHVIEAALS